MDDVINILDHLAHHDNQNNQQPLPLDPNGRINVAMMAGFHLRLGNLQTIEDPYAMLLTALETERALAIKEAVAADDRLEALSDFEYGQFALTTPDLTIPEILEAIHRLQCFRKEYGILDTIADGVEAMERFTLQHPQTYLAIEYLPDTGNLMFFIDWAAFLPAVIATDEQQQIFTKGEYYKLRSLAPTFRSIREGLSILVECEGVTHRNVSFSLNERILVELYGCRMENWKEAMFLNTPTVANIAHALWRRYLSTQLQQCTRVGYRLDGFEGRRISDLFLVPSPERARRNLIRNVEFFLTARAKNQTVFRLPGPGDPVEDHDVTRHLWRDVQWL